MDVYQKPRNTIMRANALLLFVAFFGFTTNASAQNIIIDPNPTPTQLVQNTLIGPGLVTSNITFSGNLQQIGFFDENGSQIDFNNKSNCTYFANPADINVLHEYDADPRTVDKLFDNNNYTCDDMHVWLAPFDFSENQK